ncbi:hypothetical protein [Mesorhizobium sp.]|nr:hypothetical protein [Mesorhizobium sp.]
MVIVFLLFQIVLMSGKSLFLRMPISKTAARFLGDMQQGTRS